MVLSPRAALAQQALNAMAGSERRLEHERGLLYHLLALVAQKDREIQGWSSKAEADREALVAALQTHSAPSAGQPADARVGRLRGAGTLAPSMRPAGGAAAPLGSGAQGWGQPGCGGVGLARGARTAAACLQPRGGPGVLLGGQPCASDSAAMLQSAAALESGMALRRLDAARFPLGVPSAAELELQLAQELSAAMAMRTAAGARPIRMLKNTPSLAALWCDYAVGSPGQPPYRVLELGGKGWRQGKQAWRARWSEVVLLIEHVKARAAAWGKPCLAAAQKIDEEELGNGSIGLFTFHNKLKAAAAAAAAPEAQAAAAAKRAVVAEQRAAAAAARKAAAAAADGGIATGSRDCA